MARIHGLEHLQGLAATTLTHHNPLGAHTQTVNHQIADGDLALTLNVRRARLERDLMLLAQLKLGSIFDRDDALVFGNKRR